MFLKKNVFFLVGLAITILVHAQKQIALSNPDPEYKSYHWDSNPKLHPLSSSEQNMGMVIIIDKRMVEYYSENGEIVMYTTRHIIARVNSEKAIAEVNTVYIPMPEGATLEDVQARAITKEGKITALNSANIKDVDNFQNMGHFKIFAIDGIEPGSEVEYMYTIKEPSRKTGTEYIQTNSLVKNFIVDIYSPLSITFDSKSYNGFPAMQVGTTTILKRHIFCIGNDIRGFDREEYSADAGSLMRMEFKYAYNSNDTSYRLDTWNDFSGNLYTALNKETTKKDIRLARKIIDTMKLDGLSEDDKIRKIETSIKTTISLKENLSGKNTSALESIFANDATDELGMLKLYDLLFASAGINYEIVLTTNRFDKPFDGSFDSWTYLQKYLIYFPGTGNYIAPTEPTSRYGFVPEDWICQQGLFIHWISMGDKFKTGVGEIRDISCNDWKQSMNDLIESAKFDLDMGMTNIHLKETFTGYEAYEIQPFYTTLSEEDKKDVVNRIIQAIFPDAKPANISVAGDKKSDWFRKPFAVEADLSTNSVLEQAGNKFLFKIGDLIGPQQQLYDDTIRHTPIENHHNHGYHRELAFEVPDGYKVTNLDAVNMDVFHETNGERDMEFHSFYKTDGNKITVTIDEDYRQIRYPISMYEEFRRVINASADFNKVVLFIEKKSTP